MWVGGHNKTNEYRKKHYFQGGTKPFGKQFAHPFLKRTEGGVHHMLDFIIAGALYILLMFIIFFVISFLTIGIAYAVGSFIRRCMQWFRSPDLALK